tara:strand:- start:407 stop:652 length:246 start_codon:yes stop_codon:yes gene_type:complete
MKKTLLALIITLFSTSAFAYSCPMLWEELDYEINLAKEAGVSPEKIKEIQEMRNAGKKAHDDGNHSKSEEILNKALELIKS